MSQNSVKTTTTSSCRSDSTFEAKKPHFLNDIEVFLYLKLTRLYLDSTLQER